MRGLWITAAVLMLVSSGCLGRADTPDAPPETLAATEPPVRVFGTNTTLLLYAVHAETTTSMDGNLNCLRLHADKGPIQVLAGEITAQWTPMTPFSQRLRFSIGMSDSNVTMLEPGSPVLRHSWTHLGTASEGVVFGIHPGQPGVSVNQAVRVGLEVRYVSDLPAQAYGFGCNPKSL